jgi:hypothetical protein
VPRQRKPPKNTVIVRFDSRIALQKIAAAVEAAGMVVFVDQNLDLYVAEKQVRGESKQRKEQQS